ncbi:hypothetical protein IGI04_036491, partial [Brassica rapa subsp. trilocularis]
MAMNWSNNFFHSKKRSYDPPSIDEAATPSIDGHFESKRSKLHPNRKRKPRWENTDVSKPTMTEQYNYNKVEIDELVEEIYRVIRTSHDYHSKRFDDIYYPFNNNISWLTTRTDEMKNLAMLQKQHGVGARRSKSIDTHTQTSIDASIQASIDAHFAQFEDRLQSFTYRLDGVYYPLRDRRRTRPSIDGDNAARQSKLITEKTLQDKLEEITFSQDLLKENVYQELNDISETTHARLGMQQRIIGNLQHRMHAKCLEEPKLTSNLFELNLLVLGLGIYWIGILLQVWK